MAWALVGALAGKAQLKAATRARVLAAAAELGYVPNGAARGLATRRTGVLGLVFPELGWPPRLFHGGFGLLTVGNLRKPRFWALALLGRLGRSRLPARVGGDGAGGMVDALAARGRHGRVAVLVWNGTLDQGKVAGDPLLGREVRVTVSGLGAGRVRCSHYRVDERHSNVLATWRALGRPDWPDQAGWAALRAADHLEHGAPPRELAPRGGALEAAFHLEMPGIALLELEPVP